MRFSGRPRTLLRTLVLLYSFSAFLPCAVQAQEATPKLAEKSAEKKAEDAAPLKKAENPAQIELLETRYRFESDGSSRKEVHTRVRINSELGVRQFARLNFDYNRSFESVEIPLVRITHSSGGIADILPSAITDQPNPAVVNAPAYQDVRVKSVRILGLAPGDLLEYRVITITSHHPLAPDFWLDHSFDRTGVVSQELFELDLPASRFEKISQPDDPNDPLHLGPPLSLKRPPVSNVYFSPDTPPSSVDSIGVDDSARTLVRWQHSGSTTSRVGPIESDVALSTFSSLDEFSRRLARLIDHGDTKPAEIIERKLEELFRRGDSYDDEIGKLYDFVSKKIVTIDLPLGSTGFSTRSPAEILSSGYATPEDKIALLIALHRGAHHLEPRPILVSSNESHGPGTIRPTLFQYILVSELYGKRSILVDPGLEVAPIGLIPSNLRGKATFLVLNYIPSSEMMVIPWGKVSANLPFPAKQKVRVEGTLGVDGNLTAKVHYSIRGDNELPLRVAFHQAPKEKWKDLAQLLSLSDGFRGKVSTVTVSDPYATREPFTVDYEITMPKFVDWSKKPVLIPALLPQIGLPDPPAKPAKGAASSAIELGTPLEVETRMTLHLPPGTTVLTPTGTSVQRDYATFASQYSVNAATITASRHVNFLLREVPADRAADYNAFLRAVQNDEAQDFTLERIDSPNESEKPNAPKSPAPPQTAEPKP